MSGTPPPIGYVATGYPYPSHTFIQNEVLALRRLGVDVRTFTPSRSVASAVLSDADRDALETTFSLRPVVPITWARAHLAALLSGGWLRGLRAAWRARGADWRSPVWQLFYFGQAVVLWWAARRAGVRHLHAHFANVGSDVAMLAVAIGGPDWSWSFTMHGPTEFRDETHFRLDKKVRDARFVVCISHFARSQLMALSDSSSWDKLRIVHCGVNPGSLPSPRARARESVQVLCVGRLVPEKGQWLLVDAVARLAAEEVRIELVLVGDGSSRAALEAAVAETGAPVSLLGALSHPEVLSLVAECDVFCLPSFAEGVPVSLMEAMALRKPVLSSRIMGIPELITDGETGLMVSPGDSDALVDALRELAADEALRERLGNRAAARVAADFDIDKEAGLLRNTFIEFGAV